MPSFLKRKVPEMYAKMYYASPWFDQKLMRFNGLEE